LHKKNSPDDTLIDHNNGQPGLQRHAMMLKMRMTMMMMTMERKILPATDEDEDEQTMGVWMGGWVRRWVA